jgi:hypothetical protein
MCAQLDLQVISKRTKKKETNLFSWTLEWGILKRNKKDMYSLMFEHYNLMDPMELEAITFWDSYPRRQLQDPMVTFKSFYILIFWKKISLTMSYLQNLSKKHKEF